MARKAEKLVENQPRKEKQITLPKVSKKSTKSILVSPVPEQEDETNEENVERNGDNDEEDDEEENSAATEEDDEEEEEDGDFENSTPSAPLAGSATSSFDHVTRLVNAEPVLLTELTLKNVEKVEECFNLNWSRGVRGEVRGMVNPPLISTITRYLKAHKISLEKSFLDWAPATFLKTLRELLSGTTSQNDETGVARASREIRNTTKLITSRDQDESMGVFTDMNVIMDTYVKEDARNDTAKEPCTQLRDAILAVFNRSHFGRELVKSFKAEKMAGVNFDGWWDILTQKYVEVNSLVRTALPYMEEEKKEGTNNPLTSKKDGKSGINNSGNQKKRNREAITSTSTNDKNTPCKGCGRVHSGDCLLKQHPDWNNSNKSWADSEKGKAWASHTTNAKVLPRSMTLNREASWSPPELPKGAEKKTKSKLKTLCEYDKILAINMCNTDGIRVCYIIQPITHSIILQSKVLLDSGALGKNANYM